MCISTKLVHLLADMQSKFLDGELKMEHHIGRKHLNNWSFCLCVACQPLKVTISDAQAYGQLFLLSKLNSFMF